MKLNNKFALISVALMTGAACLTACSSDEVAENPGLSADGESVKTQFALNIPVAGRNARMTDVNTQNNNQFLGMEDILLIPHNEIINENTTKLNSYIKLPNITNGSNNAWPETDKNVKVYNDVLVPVGTSNFLFYGHAPQGTITQGTNLPEAKTSFEKGILNKKFPEIGTTKTADYSFELMLARQEESGEETATKKGKVLTALNDVLTAFGKVDNLPEDNNIKKLHAQYTSLTAGSANSVLATMQSLYNNVVTATNDETAKTIKTAIEVKFNATAKPEGDTSPKTEYTLTWKEANDYPRNTNMPDGTAIVKFDKDKTQKFIWDSDRVVIGGTPNVNVKNITFPASIYYFANTSVKTNSNPQAKFPTATTDWESGFTANNWEDKVTQLTRKIALKDNINYGVAQLTMTFKCKAATLPAKPYTVNDVTTSQYIPVGEGFNVTGVLIGGQPKSVGYNFLPTSSENEFFTNTVYDKNMPDGLKAKHNPSEKDIKTNYTLLLSNKKSGNSQDAVNFAVELTNNSGMDFRGADGIVPAGGTFYLIGKLDPSADKGVTFNDRTAVFEPDYRTTANVTISTLANAYNCIPDLRSTNLQLGLSVDLSWETGMSFDVEIGQ